MARKKPAMVMPLLYVGVLWVPLTCDYEREITYMRHACTYMHTSIFPGYLEDILWPGITQIQWSFDSLLQDETQITSLPKEGAYIKSKSAALHTFCKRKRNSCRQMWAVSLFCTGRILSVRSPEIWHWFRSWFTSHNTNPARLMQVHGSTFALVHEHKVHILSQGSLMVVSHRLPGIHGRQTGQFAFYRM